MNNPPKLTVVDFGNRAFYNIANDEVTIPSISRFDPQSEYYGTLYHELVHSTGHPSRLNRFNSTHIRQEDEEYSFEELIAEMGGAYLYTLTGINTDKMYDNSTGYIQYYMKEMTKDSRYLLRAASLAQKATQYILGEL
jgi:antirestriction protein ArdC